MRRSPLLALLPCLLLLPTRGWGTTMLESVPGPLLMVGDSDIEAQQVDVQTAQVLHSTVPSVLDIPTTALTGEGLTWADHLALTGEGGDSDWRDVLVKGSEPWVAIVLQEQRELAGLDPSDSRWIDSRDAGLALDALVAGRNATTILELTQARRDGDPAEPERYPDYPTMQAHMWEGYQAYAAAMATQARPVTIAPVGLAWQRIWQEDQDSGDDTRFRSLYEADGVLPSAAGGYLAACVLAQSISGWPSTGARMPSELDPDLALALQAAADAVGVDDPFGEVPYAWASTWEDWTAAVSSGDPAPVIAGKHGVRRTVGIDGGVAAGTDVELGGQGPGRLLLWGQAHASLGTVTVGHNGLLDVRAGLIEVGDLQATTSGVVLRVSGGSLTVDGASVTDGAILQVDGGALALQGLEASSGLGSLQVVSGALALASGSTAAADLDLTGGTAVVSLPASLDGDLSLSAESQLQLMGSGPDDALQVGGSADLAGTLVMGTPPDCETGPRTVLRAQAIHWSGSFTGPDAQVAVVASADGDALVVHSTLPCDTGAPAVQGEEGGCGGCATGSASGRGGGAAAGLVGLLGLLRRRRGRGRGRAALRQPRR